MTNADACVIVGGMTDTATTRPPLVEISWGRDGKHAYKYDILAIRDPDGEWFVAGIAGLVAAIKDKFGNDMTEAKKALVALKEELDMVLAGWPEGTFT